MSSSWLFLVGAPKCGTSSLAESLRYTDEVYVPLEKELYFFSEQALNVKSGPSKINYEKFAIKDFEHYQIKNFSQNKSNLINSDFSTDSLYFLDSFKKNVKKYINGDVYIIVMVRHPLDAIVSRYKHNVVRGWETLPINQAIASWPERKKLGWSFDFDYIGQFDYSGVELLKKEFENVKVVISEDFFSSNPNVYQEIKEFLSLSKTPKERKKADPIQFRDNHQNKIKEFVKVKLFRLLPEKLFLTLREVYRVFLSFKSSHDMKRKETVAVDSINPNERLEKIIAIYEKIKEEQRC